MLRTVQSLPLAGLSTLGFDPARFQTEPPVCYRASWQLPGPDSHRQATTSTNTKITRHITRSPPVLLGARKIRASQFPRPWPDNFSLERPPVGQRMRGDLGRVSQR